MRQLELVIPLLGTFTAAVFAGWWGVEGVVRWDALAFSAACIAAAKAERLTQLYENDRNQTRRPR